MFQDISNNRACQDPTFYLGTHEPSWLARTAVPLFVSDVRLARMKHLPASIGIWALDSGAFSRLSQGRLWTIDDTYHYVERLYHYQEIGNMQWAAPQDWMCEPFIQDITGKSVDYHLHATVENVCILRSLAPDIRIIPVLQGYKITDYFRCLSYYRYAGIDLSCEPVVGLGSICRRQGTAEIAHLIESLTNVSLRLHAFGVKVQGMRLYGHMLASLDSMAWSFDARRKRPMPGHTHKNCANCLPAALAWRERLLHE